MRARTRAVAAAAGAALVVVPLTGAAAAALVTTEPTVAPGGTQDSTLAITAQGSYSADLVEIPEVTSTHEAEDFTLETPKVDVELPPPPPPPPAPAPATTVSQTRSTQPSASVQAAIAGSAIIAEAAKYVGTPYLLGGSTPAGFDCTGFVSYVYAKFGISLPRSSGAYYNVGVRVSSPEPGDLIVSPGHVGIYAGPNLQIDSPRPGKTIQFRPIWQSNPVYVRVTG